MPTSDNHMITRRAALATAAAVFPAARTLRALTAIANPPTMGLVIHSFPVHIAADRAAGIKPGFSDPATFLAHAQRLGAGGIQVGLGTRSDADAASLAEKARAANMYLEGIVALPRDHADLARFEAEIQTARRAGATIVRTVMLSGRRYETFKSLDDFRAFAKQSTQALESTIPIVERHDIRLAVENHKDWLAADLASIIERIGSKNLGVCLDTGNSIALLEDPIETVNTLALFAFTTHFKDMAVQEAKTGFRLAEVPLGTGVLDLPRIVRTLRAVQPDIHLNLEMITRDPLEIPCLEDRYWPTFPDLPATQLARMLAFVRAHPPAQPLPQVSTLAPAAQLRLEDQNIDQSLTFARRSLVS